LLMRSVSWRDIAETGLFAISETITLINNPVD
jgi:hypothetical protein